MLVHSARPHKFRHPTLYAAGLALAGLLPGTAGAQGAFDLEAITIFANRTPTELARSGASVTVVERAEIERAGDATLAEVLARQPSLSFTQTGGPGQTGSIRLRGGHPGLVAVFVDGIPLRDSSSTDGSYDFGGLRTGDIERVEIIRGAQSALYGTSAVAGVVQITTRRPETEGTRQTLAIEGGSYATGSFAYGLAQRGARHELTFNLTHFYTGGFSAADRRTTPGARPDSHRSSRASFTAAYDLSDALRLGASGFRQWGFVEFDGGPNVEALNASRADQSGARVFAEWRTGATLHTFSATATRIDRFLSPFGGARYIGDTYTFGYQGDTEVSGALRLIYGADTTLETYRSTFNAGSMRVSGAYATALWAPSERLDVSAALRRDINSVFGGATTGRLAVAFRPVDGWVLRASAGRGFRAPSPFQQAGGFALGPLSPETSNSLDIGLEREFARGRIGVTLFALDTVDEVIFDPTPVAGFPFGGYRNDPGRTMRRGVEVAGRVALTDRIDLSLAYSYIDARTPAGGIVLRVPRNDIAIGLDARLTDRLSGGVQLLAVEGMRDVGDARVPGYAVVNASFSYALARDTALTLRVDNLFNRQYQKVLGYGTSDRAVYIGLRRTF